MDSMTTYKNEIAHFPLLTAKEEKSLARKIKKGNESARETLINSNLRLVLFMAQKFQNRGLDMDDLIMEGNLGLMKAVEKFSPYRDTRFSTYACAWIEQTIRRGIANTAQTIRVPVHVSEAQAKLSYKRTELFGKLGHEPSNEELGQALGVTENKIEQLMESGHMSLSLDADTHNDSEMTFKDLLRSREQAPDESAFEGISREQVAGLLNKLSDNEATVLKFRHGFDENDPHTLDAIGKKLGLTRERVRQIEENALAHLRELVA
jgi:RNA polymerase primary sigma factor